MSAKDLPEFTETEDSSLRGFRRYLVALSVSVWLAEEDEGDTIADRLALAQPRPACVEDLSLSGLYFISTAPFASGARVAIQMRLGSAEVLLQAVVRRRKVVDVSGRRHYGCGVQFLRTEDTPQALMTIILYLKAQRRQGAVASSPVSA